MRGEFVAQAKAIGVSNFVYRARRPFHPGRLWDLIEQDTFDGVIRSKGFFWLCTFNSTIGDWSQAGMCPTISSPSSSSSSWTLASDQHTTHTTRTGDIMNFRPEGRWFATMPEADWPVDEAMTAKIKLDFDSDPRVGTDMCHPDVAIARCTH
jgi:hypothetical protein